MDKSEIIFWSDLEIPIEDFIEELNNSFKRFTRTIFNRFENKSQNWLKLLDVGSDIDKLREEFNKDNLRFLRAYCCSWFAHKLGNLTLIKDFAQKYIKEEVYKKYENDDQVLTYLLHKSNNEILVDIYFEHFIQKTNFDTYIGDIKKPAKHSIILNKENSQKALNKFENRKKTKRQKSLIWWFKENSDSWYIIFRRSRLKGIPIKLLHHNQFVRTADSKIFKISKTFQIAEIYSKKEPKRMVNCISFIASEIADIEVNYIKQEREYKTNKVNNFISGILSSNPHKIMILDAEMRNVPLNSSPTMILKSEGTIGINQALLELKNDGKLPHEREFTNLKFLYNNKKYQIRLNRFGEETGIALSQKGLSMNDRQTILNFLDNIFL